MGLSIGGFAIFHTGIEHADRVMSLVIAGCGYVAAPDQRAAFKPEIDAAAALFQQAGPVEVAKKYTMGPTRGQYENKDPRGWAEFAAQMAEHNAVGSANPVLGVQKMRPSLWELAQGMKKIQVPALVITGEEDALWRADQVWYEASILAISRMTAEKSNSP